MTMLENIRFRCQKILIGAVLGVFFWIFFQGLLGEIPISAQVEPNRAQTTIRLNIAPTDNLEPELREPVLTLTVNPDSNSFRFDLGPVRLNDGSIVANEQVDLVIRIEGSPNRIVLRGTSNTEGILTYDTTLPLEAQGLELIEGSIEILQDLDTEINIDESFGIAYFNGESAESNRVNYIAPEPEPEPTPIVPPITPRTGGDILLFSFLLIGLVVTVWLLASWRTRKKYYIR